MLGIVSIFLFAVGAVAVCNDVTQIDQFVPFLGNILQKYCTPAPGRLDKCVALGSSLILAQWALEAARLPQDFIAPLNRSYVFMSKTLPEFVGECRDTDISAKKIDSCVAKGISVGNVRSRVLAQCQEIDQQLRGAQWKQRARTIVAAGSGAIKISWGACRLAAVVSPTARFSCGAVSLSDVFTVAQQTSDFLTISLPAANPFASALVKLDPKLAGNPIREVDVLKILDSIPLTAILLLSGSVDAVAAWQIFNGNNWASLAEQSASVQQFQTEARLMKGDYCDTVASILQRPTANEHFRRLVLKGQFYDTCAPKPFLCWLAGHNCPV